MRKIARKRFRSIRCGCEKGIIENLPRKVTRVCLLFLRRGGSYYEMYSNRTQEYSADLAQGGSEVPCSLLFKATLVEHVGSEAHCLAKSCI